MQLQYIIQLSIQYDISINSTLPIQSYSPSTTLAPCSYPMSLQQQQQNQTHICYYYINQSASAWTCIPLFVIGLAILIYAVWQLKITWKQDKLNTYVRLTYVAIIVALIFYQIKVILSETLFWVQLYKDDNNTVNYQSQIASQYLFFIDFTGIFAMQTSVLLVPTNWVTNIYQMFLQLSQSPQISPSQSLQYKQSTKFQQKCSKISLSYLKIRLVLFCLIMIPYLALVNRQYALSILIRIMMIWFCLQSVGVIVFLVLGVLSVRDNQLLHKQLTEQEMQIMKNNYYLLIACTTVRFAVDLVYTVINYNQITENSRCQINASSDTIPFQISNIILQGLFTQFLTIVIILHIYKVADDENSQTTNDDESRSKDTSQNQSKNRSKSKSKSKSRSQIVNNDRYTNRLKDGEYSRSEGSARLRDVPLIDTKCT